MKTVLFHRHVAAQRDGVGIVPPQLAVLPVAVQILARDFLEGVPDALDVAGTARAVDQAEAGPDGMIASEDEAVAGALEHGLHAAAIGFDARGFGIVEVAAVHRAPEVGVELEVSHAPLVAHGAEDGLQVLLHFGIGAVERVPGAAAPALEGDLVGGERLAVGVLHEPVGMLLEDVATGFGDERRHPDGGLEALLADGLQHFLHAAAEGASGFQPVAHGGLVAIVELHVLELRRVFGDGGEVVHHVLGGDARAEAIPTAPAGGRRGELQGRMIHGDAAGELVEQLGAIGAGGEEELLEIPGFAGSEREAFGIEHDLDGFRPQVETAVESPAACETEQLRFAAGRGEGHHAGDDARVGGLRDLVVAELVVADVDRLAECAGGLREHLETFAVERGGVGQIVRDPEERDFGDVDRRLAGVGETRAEEIAGALRGELDGGSGFDGADFGFGGPDVERGGGGESEGGEEEGGGWAEHSNTLALKRSGGWRAWGRLAVVARTNVVLVSGSTGRLSAGRRLPACPTS